MTNSLIRDRTRKVGLPPGTPVYVGKKRVEKTRIVLINYDEQNYQEKEVKTVEDLISHRTKHKAAWINLDGVHEFEVLQKISEYLGLHPLVLEDIMNTDQRPKIEDFGNYIYLVLKMLYYNEKNEDVIIEQLSLVLGSDFLVSFQERSGDVFDPIRDRIRNNRGLVRKMGVDYLAYALIDSIVDNYFTILERLGEKIEDLEDELISNPTTETLQKIHRLKRHMVFLRKSVWPLREAISKLERERSPLIKENTVIYLRDVYDHTIQVIDAIETFRDILSGMLDIYLSSISNRMNEVMKVLTIIATIFIPLTLVAGIYGMNFKFMPELESQWGYPAVLLCMFIIGIIMLVYFKKKKWL